MTDEMFATCNGEMSNTVYTWAENLRLVCETTHSPTSSPIPSPTVTSTTEGGGGGDKSSKSSSSNDSATAGATAAAVILPLLAVMAIGYWYTSHPPFLPRFPAHYKITRGIT